MDNLKIILTRAFYLPNIADSYRLTFSKSELISPSFFVQPVHFSLANSFFSLAERNSSLFCKILISNSRSDNLSVAVSNFSFLCLSSYSKFATCLASVSKLFNEGVEAALELASLIDDDDDEPELSKLGWRLDVSKYTLARLDFTGLDCIELLQGDTNFEAVIEAAAAAMRLALVLLLLLLGTMASRDEALEVCCNKRVFEDGLLSNNLELAAANLLGIIEVKSNFGFL